MGNLCFKEPKEIVEQKYKQIGKSNILNSNDFVDDLNNENNQESSDPILAKLQKLTSDIFKDVHSRLKDKGYVIIDQIASGGQAEVFKGFSSNHNKECAIRVSGNDISDYESLEKEYEIIKHIKLPLNVIQLIDVEFYEDIKIYVHILELCKCSLQDEIDEMKKKQIWFTKEEQQFIIFSLCDALSEIQSYQIIHFDIKPSNILKTIKGEYVLSDFGNSKKLKKKETQSTKVYGFSYKYMSPEQFKNLEEKDKEIINLTPVSYSSDVYSMGVVLLEILGYPITFSFSMNLRKNGPLQFSSEEQKIQFELFKSKMFDQDPSKRLKSYELSLYFLDMFNEMDEKLKLQLLTKLEYILDQNKYENAKNIHILHNIIHNYSLLHLNISQRLIDQNLKLEKTIISHYHIAESYSVQGAFEMCLKHNEIVLELRKSEIPINHIKISSTLNSIAECYPRFGKINEALQYYHESIEKEADQYQVNPFKAKTFNKIASWYIELGEIYEKNGNFKEELECNLSSLKYYKIVFKEDHSLIGTSLNNIGLCYNKLGQVSIALEYHFQSLEMREKLFEGCHPHKAISLNNIAVCYYKLGKTDKSLQYHKKCLEMKQYLFTGNHPDIAFTMNNMADCYRDLGHYEQSLEYLQKGNEMYQQLYNDNHPSVAASLNNIGFAYRQLGKFDQALEYHQQSLNMFNLYPDTHPEIGVLYNNIGSCYLMLGSAEQALENHKKAEYIFTKHYRGNHPYLAINLDSIGKCYNKLEMFSEALKYLKLSLDMKEQLYPFKIHPQIASSIQNIGECYKNSGQIEEAINYFLKSLEIRKQLFSKSDITHTLNELIESYNLIGNPSKVLEYQEKLLIEESLFQNSILSI